MKKRRGLLAGAIAAALTFGVLMLTLGPKSFAKYGRHHIGKQCAEYKEKDAIKE